MRKEEIQEEEGAGIKLMDVRERKMRKWSDAGSG